MAAACECDSSCPPVRGVVPAAHPRLPLRVLDPRHPDYEPWSVRRSAGAAPWSHVFTAPIPRDVPASSAVICGAHQRESEVRWRPARPRIRVVGPLDDSAPEDAAAAALPGPVRPLPYGRFGLNNVPFFEFESGAAGSKYGHFPALIRDLREIGAGVARHPTQMQLLPEALLTTGVSPWEWPVAFPPPRLALAHVRGSEPLQRMEEAVRYCVAQKVQLKFYLTFLTVGGGFESSDVQYDTTRTPAYALGVAGAWEAGHGGGRIVDDYGTACDFDTAPSSDWNLGTLDPNNGYKRYYFRELAKALGRALQDLRADLATSGIVLEDYVEAVEIGNEVDVRNVKWDAARSNYYPDSEGWAAVYYDCATALFDATATAGVSWLKLRLPGLASNADNAGRGEAYQEWESKRVFVQEMLQQVDSLCTTFGAYTVDQLVTGIDLHYYHRFGDSTRNDIQRLAFIAADVWDITLALTSKAVSDPTLSILESMVNVACRRGDDAVENGPSYDNGCEAQRATSGGWLPYPAYSVVLDDPLGDWRPVDTTPLCPTKEDTAKAPFPSSEERLAMPVVGPNDYQAIALWHRLAVGLAGASLAGLAPGRFIAGWHGLVLANTGTFGLGGLRRDAHASTGNPRDATKALQRPSWFAMQRFIDTVGGATSVAVLNPAGLGGLRHSDLVTAIAAGSWHAESDVWVIEFENPGGWTPAELRTRPLGVYPWAYLLFVDPNGPSARCARVTLSSGGARFVARRMGTAPVAAGIAPLYLPDPRGVPDRRGFAYVEWEPEGSVDVRSSTAGRLQPVVDDHSYPTLLYSPVRLTVASVVVL